MVEQTGPLVSKDHEISTADSAAASTARSISDDESPVAARGAAAHSGPAAVGLFERIDGLRLWLLRELWHDDPDEMVLLRATRALAQLVALTFRGFRTDQLMLRSTLR